MSDSPLPTRPSHVLEDPSAKAVATVYARSFLEAAASAGLENPLEEMSSFVEELLHDNPRFERLLLTGATGREEKLGIIDRVVAPRAPAVFTNFLKVLANRERMELLPLILDETRLEHERQTGRRRVLITSAVELSSSQLQRIEERLRESLPFQPVVMTDVDPSLLGGIVIQIGDTVYDSSLRARLQTLKHRLRERYLHEIQSGRNRFSSPEGN